MTFPHRPALSFQNLFDKKRHKKSESSLAVQTFNQGSAPVWEYGPGPGSGLKIAGRWNPGLEIAKPDSKKVIPLLLIIH